MNLSWLIKAGLVIILLLVIWTLYGVFVSMSVPQASYQVLETLENGVEIREYPEEIWATAIAEDENSAFRPLFRYISGENEKGEKIEMTTPVVTPAPPTKTESAQGEGEKIEMTTPVVTTNTEKGLSMAFIMPERFDIQTIPRPTSSNVEIRVIAPRTLATIKFSGYMKEGNYRENLERLNETLETRGILTKGEPILMQYSDPWTPPFYRRNEIALQVANDTVEEK